MTSAQNSPLYSLPFPKILRVGNSATYAHAWKVANIYAIFKKGSKADRKNYSKVSLTSLTPSRGTYSILSHITTPFCKSHYLSALAWFSAGICDLGIFYKIGRGQVNISLLYDLISVPVYDHTRAIHESDQTPVPFS